MSDSDAPALAASPPIDDAIEVALGALLLDRDVSEVHCLEGGFLQTVRRGRRERIEAVLEGPLFELAREGGADRQLLTWRLRGGHRVTVGPCRDGRLALRLIKAPALDVELSALVEEQLLPAGLPEELTAAAALGGVLVLGPARAGRQRVAAAVARSAQRTLAFAALNDHVAALFPAPAGADLAARARAADALGFDALFALELDLHEVTQLLRAPLALPLVASLRACTMDALLHALGGAPASALAPLACVVGSSPDGSPRLLEVHGAVDDPAPGLEPASLSTAAGAVSQAPQAYAAAALPPAEQLSTLAELPNAWASNEPDADPGWELAGLPSDGPLPTPAVGSFDAALARQGGKPTFKPRPPRPHPQAARLTGAGSPFGGLTFEPPSAPQGTAGSDDSDAGHDEEPG